MMAWNASMATITAMQPTYSGCASYPIAPDIGRRKTITSATKSSATPPTILRAVPYTVRASSPSLLEKRNMVVSMPKVSSASSSAV